MKNSNEFVSIPANLSRRSLLQTAENPSVPSYLSRAGFSGPGLADARQYCKEVPGEEYHWLHERNNTSFPMNEWKTVKGRSISSLSLKLLGTANGEGERLEDGNDNNLNQLKTEGVRKRRRKLSLGICKLRGPKAVVRRAHLSVIKEQREESEELSRSRSNRSNISLEGMNHLKLGSLIDL